MRQLGKCRQGEQKACERSHAGMMTESIRHGKLLLTPAYSPVSIRRETPTRAGGEPMKLIQRVKILTDLLRSTYRFVAPIRQMIWLKYHAKRVMLLKEER